MSGLLGAGTAPTNAPIVYSGLNVSTSQWNLPLPVFWGQRRLTTNAIDYDDFQKHKQGAKGGGKGGGGKGGANYTYSADTLQGLCEGPVDAIKNIWSNGSTTTTTTLSALNMTFFVGTLAQAPWSYWSTKYPAKALAYAQTAYLGAPNQDLGESATVPENGFELVRTMGFNWTRTSATAGWINGATHAQDSAVDVLLSDCANDLLTSSQYGLGWSAGDIGPIAQWAAYMRAQGIVASPLLNSQEKATDLLGRWAQLSNSWVFWGGTQLMFVPLADAAVTGNGVTFEPQNDVAYTLTLADLVAEKNAAPVKVTRKDPADCYNRVSVNICDRTLGYIDNPVQWFDDNLVDAYGLRDSTSVSADDICDPAVGAIVAQLAGKRAAYIRNSYEFKTGHRFILCLPGTVLMIPLNHAGRAVRVRVTGIEEDDKGVLSFTAEEFPGTTGTYVPAQAIAGAATSSFPNLFAAPPPINTPAIVEPQASFTGGVSKIIVAASGPAGWGGCDVWLGFDGESYTKIGAITAPAVQGVLTAPLATPTSANPDTGGTLAIDCGESGATPVPVTHADAQMLRTLALVAPQPVASADGALLVPVDGELLAFGAVATTGTNAANLSYLERGQYGTAAAAHAAGEQFTLVDVLGTGGSSVTFDLPAAYIGQPLYLKLASFNLFGHGGQDLADCVEYQYVPIGAALATSGARRIASATTIPLSSDDTSISVTAFTATLTDGAVIAFPAGTVADLGAGTSYGVFYTAGAYVAVAAPALTPMASGANIFLGWQATSSGGSYAPGPATPGGGGGSGSTPQFSE